MNRPASPRFAIHIAIVFLTLGIVQLTGSLVFYQIIDRQTLRDDHARRVAELLVVGKRLHGIAPGETARSMTTRYLYAELTEKPLVERPSGDAMLTGIAASIVAWEPSLGSHPLHLATTATGRNRDLAGSMQLDDGTWFNFQSRDISTMWPVAWRAMVLTLLLTVAFLAIGLIALQRVSLPLRRLTDAAEAIGQGRPVAISESGPPDLRNLAHAMNVMQERIDRLLRDQTAALAAIGHDLRTPLSRQKAVARLVDDSELSEILAQSNDEMTRLLDSLQAYLEVQHLEAEPEQVALADFLREELGEFGDRLTVTATLAPTVTTFRQPLALALRALADNALQYGASAEVILQQLDEGWAIDIADDGPGMPEEYFQPVLEPFFRLDESRPRNTKGFGLGIPTAHRLMMRFNGGLSFSSPAGGGLNVRLIVPHPL